MLEIKQYLKLFVLIFTSLVISCATFITDEQVSSLDKYEDGVYRMKQDMTVNDMTLNKGEKVKLMVMAEEDAVKVYAYRADVSYLQSERVLILYMFDVDFGEGIFDRENFHKSLME